LLEAWELMRMDLRADLVVLSACETARGRYGAGEGVIGLTWALFVAGVPSTVVSQWKVESASARDLMLGFHRRLMAPSKAKMTKAEALRQAALELMKNSGDSHPFYWAGFVLVGDGR
jgi:CHAT domain-containing protein